MILIPVLITIVLLALLLYWLLVTTEGAFLGRKTVVWLYDVTAHRYDRIKEFDQEDEHYFIGLPIRRYLEGIHHPRLLDVATGSGRVPYDLINEPGLNVNIIGLDPSNRMLDQAKAKLFSEGLPSNQVTLVQGLAGPLPFADDAFEVVTCLESLEFFPAIKPALIELARVLKPGGLLMTSRRRGFSGRLFLNRYYSAARFEKLLQEMGFEGIRIHLWELDYDMVTAHRSINSLQ